jgi:transposase
MHIELRRTGVTLRLLHEEYVAANPNAYGYTKYCELYNAWVERLRVTMRQVHKAGEPQHVDGSLHAARDVHPGKPEQAES